MHGSKLTHRVNVTSVLAVPALLPCFEKIIEDSLHCSSMCCIGLVECEHVDKDDMSLMHEEITEEIKVLCLADLLCLLHPAQDLFAVARNNRAVVVMRANTASALW